MPAAAMPTCQHFLHFSWVIRHHLHPCSGVGGRVHVHDARHDCGEPGGSEEGAGGGAACERRPRRRPPLRRPGYQDTLYAHSNRQFYRDRDVNDTVDAVFGNAAAMLQCCTLRARVPQPSQTNTVTSQARSEPCQRTGIVLHTCRLVPAPDLAGGRGATYLGQPWRPYSRVVVMESYIGEHVAPQGWLEWNASGASALDTLYYGEYMNHGPRACRGPATT